MAADKSPLQTLVYSAVLGLAIGWLLYAARSVLAPAAFSVVVVYIVLGLARLMARIKWLGPLLPASVRYAISVLLIVLALWGIALLLIDTVEQVASNSGQYERTASAILQRGGVLLGLETEPSWAQVRQLVIERIGVTRLIGSSASVVLSIGGLLAVVLLYATFLLLEQRAFDQKIGRLSEDPQQVGKLRAVISAINERVGNYLALKSLLSAMLGVATWLSMVIFGLGFAGIAGLLVGLLNFIPYLGSVLGVVIPVLLALLQGADPRTVFWLGAVLGVVQFLNGNLLDPYLMGKSLNLSPFVILFSLAAWSSLWGVSGALLAVPFAAIMVIVFSEFPGTRPLAVLLSRDGEL